MAWGAVTETVATLAGGLFAGAATYITLVEHPARLSCGTLVAMAEFRPSYRRAAFMQGGLALVGAVAGIVRWALLGGAGWLLGGLLLGALIPFTLVVIMPTNKRLLDPAFDAGSREAAALLGRWGRLHAARSVAGLAAFVIFLGSR